MKPVELSIVESLDGTDMGLFPYLPYILQDLWKIGSSPEVILNLIQKHCPDSSNLKILDLGCGKGAVTIRLAKEFNCRCHGIDAMPEFIKEAKQKACEQGVEGLCRFEENDIRNLAFGKTGYDVIVLGSIGPVMGNYFKTLSALSGFLTDRGMIVMDDGFIDDQSNFSHPSVEKKIVMIEQIKNAGMRLVEEYVIQPSEIKESNELIFMCIKRRCHELMSEYPEKREMFNKYIMQQQKENEVLETKVICSTFLIKPVQI